MQAAGSVEDDGVGAVGRELLDAVVHDLHRIRAVLPVDGHLDLAAELLELVDRGGALQVGGDETRRPPFLAQQQRELCGRGRLARALEPREQDHGRRSPGEHELRAAGTHQLRQLLMDDLHDLLARGDALQDLLAQRPLSHLRDEVLDDLEVDVGLE